MRSRLVDGLLVLAVVALVAVPLALGSDTEFGGADGVAVEAIEADDPGYEPWAAPLFEPAAETASGLFALQAALGAGVLGYALGAFRTRRRLAGCLHRHDADTQRLHRHDADIPAEQRPRADGA